MKMSNYKLTDFGLSFTPTGSPQLPAKYPQLPRLLISQIESLIYDIYLPLSPRRSTSSGGGSWGTFTPSLHTFRLLSSCSSSLAPCAADRRTPASGRRPVSGFWPQGEFFTSLLQGAGGGEQNGKVAGPKLISSYRVKLFAAPNPFLLKGRKHFAPPPSAWLKLQAPVLKPPQNVLCPSFSMA